MISELATVVSVQGQNITLQTLRSSACSSCKVKSGCGQGLLATVGDEYKQEQKNYITIESDLSVDINEQVELVIPEALLVKSALLVYLMPLLAMCAMSLLLSALTNLQGVIAIGGISALLLAFYAVAKIDQHLKQREDFSVHIKKRHIVHQFVS